MFSMVYDGAQRFFIAPQIAPHLPLLRPFCQHCALFAYWPDLTSSQMVKLKHGVQIAAKNERL
mgnify:CR=1 FL=1